MTNDTLKAATVHTLRCIGRFGGPRCIDRAVRLYLSVAPPSPRERALWLEDIAAMLLVAAAYEPHVDNVYAAITDRIFDLTQRAEATG